MPSEHAFPAHFRYPVKRKVTRYRETLVRMLRQRRSAGCFRTTFIPVARTIQVRSHEIEPLGGSLELSDRVKQNLACPLSVNLSGRYCRTILRFLAWFHEQLQDDRMSPSTTSSSEITGNRCGRPTCGTPYLHCVEVEALGCAVCARRLRRWRLFFRLPRSWCLSTS